MSPELDRELEQVAQSLPSGIPHDFAELRRVLALLPGASPTSPVGGSPPFVGDSSVAADQGTVQSSSGGGSQTEAVVAGASGAGSTPPVQPAEPIVAVIPVGPPPAPVSMLPGISIAPLTMPGSALTAGALNDITKFASTIRPPVVVTSLPTLPSTSYPAGSTAFNTTDGCLYKTSDGNAWTKLVGAGDLQASSIVAGTIAAGAIGASQIAAGSITADKLAATLLLASTLVAGSAGGARIELDTNGIRCYASDGATLMAYLPTNGSAFYFNGSVMASTLTSLGGVLAGTTFVASNSGVVVSSNVVAPMAPVLADALSYRSLAVSLTGHGACFDNAGGVGGATVTLWVGADPSLASNVIAYELDFNTGAVLRTHTRHVTATTAPEVMNNAQGAATTYHGASLGTNTVFNITGSPSRVGVTVRATAMSAYNIPGSGGVIVPVIVENGVVLEVGSGSGSLIGRAIRGGMSFGMLVQSGSFQAQGVYPSSGTYSTYNPSTGAVSGSSGAPGPIHADWTVYTETADEGQMGRTVGIARQGSSIWTLDDVGILYKFNQSDLTFVAKYDLSASISGVKANAGLYWDGTNLVITTTTVASGTGQAKLVKVTTGGAFSSSISCSGLTLGDCSTAAVRGGYDDATNVWLAIVDTTYKGVFAFNRTTGANVANRDYGLQSEMGSGVAWDGSYAYGVNLGTARANTYLPAWDWSSATQPWWVVATWRLAAGPYETTIGAASSISFGRRRRLSVTTGPIPYGADQCRVYAVMQASAPTFAQVKLQVTDALTSRILYSDAGGAAAPSSNNFPATTPAVIGDPGNKWYGKGDGTFRQTVPGGIFKGTQASIANGSAGNVVLDTNTQLNTPGLHFTSAANLTGTVAKTATSAGIVGTGTSFTTELSVGQVVQIPGTANEWFVVTAIADNTHFTAHRTATNTATGQTGVRLNHVMAIPSGCAGWWQFVASMTYPSVTAALTNEADIIWYKTADGVTVTALGGGGNYGQASTGNYITAMAEAVLAVNDIVYAQFSNKLGSAQTPTLAYLSAKLVSL